ncbi:MAG: DUF2254 domain-containing protein [Croceibacterium sp.]
MLTRFRAIWHRVNASYWFYPALFSLAALLLALATIWLDRNGWAGWLSDVKAIQPARPQGASNMLTVISGSMIGTAATVFSITIAAVAYASGNYGPRLLTNFMEDKGNQLSLATFIGTFVYAITVLRSVRAEGERSALVLTDSDQLPGFVPQLSLLIAFALMVVSIMVLVYFLNHIPDSIRINNVLRGIGVRLLKSIDSTFPDPDSGAGAITRPSGEPVRASETGYIQLIDFARLQRIAEKHGGRIALAVRTGDFIHPGVAIAYWCPGLASTDGVSPVDDIRESYSLGSSRTPHQDLEFLIDELVEIGLRALSPGINDPMTAITALHWLGAATAELGQRDLRLRSDLDRRTDERLIVPIADDFGHFVARGFGAMRSAGATNRLAANAMFETLTNAASVLDDETRLATLRREGDQLARQFREHLKGPELELAEARYASFQNALRG